VQGGINIVQRWADRFRGINDRFERAAGE